MANKKYSRRKFLEKSIKLAAGLVAAGPLSTISCIGVASPFDDRNVKKTAAVSIVKIKEGKIERAVEEAIDLLGGINAVTAGKERIMLKPNLDAFIWRADCTRCFVKVTTQTICVCNPKMSPSIFST